MKIIKILYLTFHKSDTLESIFKIRRSSNNIYFFFQNDNKSSPEIHSQDQTYNLYRYSNPVYYMLQKNIIHAAECSKTTCTGGEDGSEDGSRSLVTQAATSGLKMLVARREPQTQ